MKTNRKFMKLAAVLLTLVLVSSAFLGGTFAKYVTELSGPSDTATVAKWDITAGTAKLDIFNGKKLLPGATGTFVLNSGVDKGLTDDDITVATKLSGFAVTATGFTDHFPIEFTIDGVVKTYTGANVVIELAKDLEAAPSTVVITWNWVFFVNAATDAKDTALGMAPTLPTLEISANVLAEQVAA